MIQFSRHILDNGLTVICHTDKSTPFVSVNVLYKVGSRNEQADKTGFAHLFEHLMFGGSTHIEDYDKHVQLAGGESNAYTTNDLTNYYTTIPASNIETALWLESDRMAGLNLSPSSLDIQKHVVIEEFKQRYLNNPYGDLWLKLRPLAYKVHPYRWATIGVSPEHIERATLEDVGAFFRQFYAPDNAIVSICGNIAEDKALELVKNGSATFHQPTDRLVTSLPNPGKQRNAVRSSRITMCRQTLFIRYFTWVDGIATIFMPVISSPTFYPTGNLHVSMST